MQPSEEHEHNPVHLQNISYSEAVKLNTDIVQPSDADVVIEAKSMVVNKIDDSVTIAVDNHTTMPPKPIQVRKISRFQVSHVQEDNIPKINALSNNATVEVENTEIHFNFLRFVF